jgi:hypothetical protein
VSRGVDTLRRMYELFAAENYDAAAEVVDPEFELVAEDFVEAGDHVVVLVRNSGRGVGGGVPIEARRAHVWGLRDGVPVSFRLYLDPDEALAAVGASG